MDQELMAYLDERFRGIDERFRETSQQITGLRDETVEHFGRVEDEIRHTRVEVEGLRGDLRLLAEGMLGVNEKLDAFRGDVTQRIDEVRTFVKISYSDLDRRVRPLETWKETKERDPVEIVRERLKNGTI